MKTLILVRHAKSSWDDISQNDFVRPLNEKGHQDAPMMAKRLLKHNIKIAALITSPAKRALSTCKYFAETFEIKKKKILQDKRLYLADYKIFFNVVNDIDDDFDAVALFSHNSGITNFANLLSKTKIDNMPTCGIFAVESDIKHWADFCESANRFLFFDYPKNAI